MATSLANAFEHPSFSAHDTPRLVARGYNLPSSSSSPMIDTPAKMAERLLPPKWDRPNELAASATSVASTSSQDSHISSQTSIVPESRPRSVSPSVKMAPPHGDLPPLRSRTLSQQQPLDIGLGFGAGVQYAFHPAVSMPPSTTMGGSGVRMVPATPPPPGSTTPGSFSTKGVMERFLSGEQRRDAADGLATAAQMAADAEARALSEAEEAASILVNSVATTPRQYRRAPARGHVVDDHEIVDVGLGRSNAGTPIAASFMGSSPPLSAVPSVDRSSARPMLPTSTPQHDPQQSFPPSSADRSDASVAQSLQASTSTAPAARPKSKKASKATTMSDPNAKPPFSYAGLIGQSILAQPDNKLSLNDIYVFIMSKYPFYKKEDAGWQNSIRHNLSLNECFIKTARDAANPGKGCLWSIQPGTEEQFEGGNFVKRSAMGKKKAQAAAAAAAAAAKVAKAQAIEEAKAEGLLPVRPKRTNSRRQPPPEMVEEEEPKPERKRPATREPSPEAEVEQIPVSASRDQPMSEEGEDNEPTLSEEEAMDMDTSEEMIAAPPARKRQRLAPAAGLPLPAYPPRHSPVAHTRFSTSRNSRVSPPMYDEPNAMMRRMSNPYPVAPPRNYTADAIMSSPGGAAMIPPPRFFPGAGPHAVSQEGPAYLQAAPLIRAGHRRQTSSAREDIRAEGNEPRTRASTSKTPLSPGSLITQSPVSSLRSAFVPSQQAQTSTLRGATSSVRGGIAEEEEADEQAVSPPMRGGRRAHDEQLQRTPPSEARSAVYSTPRRGQATPGRFSTPAGWSSSQYDPYDHGGAVLAGMEDMRSKALPPTPKFSTPHQHAMTPW